MDKKTIPLVVVVGPTASGKTDLGVFLAKRFSGEVISADSMQVYKGMHIASAAPDAYETEGIPHHLIEFLEPDKAFSVSDYVNLANEKINDVYSRGKLPILVGGTGLYVNSLTENIDFGDIAPDEELRLRLGDEFDRLGGEAMLKRLREADSAYADTLHMNDRKRIIRALEIIEQTGSTVTERLRESRQGGGKYNVLFLGVTFSDRELLYDRINLRVDKMLERGLIEEARAMRSRSKVTAAQAIGHKELYEYFEGNKTLDEAADYLKMQTRRYAKRQLTWFRKNENINWIYRDKEDVYSKAEALTNDFLKEE